MKTFSVEALSYERLLKQDEDEVKKLVKICSDSGMFFLDLRGPSTSELLLDLQPIIAAQRKFFGQQPDMKLPYADPRDGRG
jgi:hypothetical protein